ncbi:MAG: hypothetical protein ACLQNE_35030 [Thermoguttaceae bacterium]
MIFPLALAPFEEYMLADDRPAYPMTFFLRLRLAGRFGLETFPQALRTAVSRHPLLSALVRQVGRRRPEWIAANRADPPVYRMPQPGGNGLPHAEPIDLRKEPGLRLWLLEGERTTHMVAQFHHACCDGLGAVAFIEDLLVAYAMAMKTSANGPSLCPIEFERLRGRARFGWSAWSLLKLLPRQLVGLAGVRQFFAHAPSPAVPSSAGQDAAALPAQYPAVLDRQLTVAETTALGLRARREEATVNDILVRDWYLAMGDWRSRCFSGRSGDWLRLAVPINLRTAEDRRAPAANIVSMVFLDRRAADFGDPADLLHGVHQEMGQIKRCRLGLTFLLSLSAIRTLPGCLARMADTDRCSATGVLTNFGIVMGRTSLPTRDGNIVAGDVALEAIDCAAPLRPHTHVAMAALTYAGRLRILLHYDPRALLADQAESLLDTFMACVRTSLSRERTEARPEFLGKAA